MPVLGMYMYLCTYIPPLQIDTHATATSVYPYYEACPHLTGSLVYVQCSRDQGLCLITEMSI